MLVFQSKENSLSIGVVMRSSLPWKIGEETKIPWFEGTGFQFFYQIWFFLFGHASNPAQATWSTENDSHLMPSIRDTMTEGMGALLRIW